MSKIYWLSGALSLEGGSSYIEMGVTGILCGTGVNLAVPYREYAMITLSQMTELLGWASIINIGFLILATLSIVLMRENVSSIHSRMFGISQKDLLPIYFNYLANYKLLSLIFCVIPYISLKIMGT